MSALTTFRNNLKKLGLTDHEIDLYFSALKHPDHSIYDTSKRAGLSKTTGYRVFEQLREKGLVELHESKIQPRQLHDFLRKREKERNTLSKAIDSLKDSSQLFRYFAEDEEDFFVETLRGEELIERYVDLASYYHWKNIFAIGNFEMFITRLGMAAEKDFIHERLKKGKTATGLFTTDDEYSQDFAQVGQKELRTSVINTDVDMGEKWINVLPDIDTTAFFQADDLGLKMTLVKSKDISDAQTALFQNLWKQSRK